jgi:GDP-4-dehydro-6-deoxy-D-mannose reductase
VALDLGDPRQVRDAVESTRPDVVLHLAGASSVSGSWDDPGSAFRANASGTAALLRTVELIVPEAQFVLASSAAVYGRPAPGPGGSPQPFTEDQTTRPTSPYGASKAAAEILAFESRARTGLPVTSARLFNQIGPGQGGNDAPVQFARAIARAETAGETSVGIEVGDPEAARDYTDVRDTARALRLITERRATGRLNVCSGKATTLGALIAVLDGLTGLNVRIEADPSRAHRNDVQVVAGSPELLNEKTGWSPRIPLEQSLSALLDSQRAALAH